MNIYNNFRLDDSDKKMILDFIQENTSLVSTNENLSPNKINNSITNDANIINANINNLGINNININNIPIKNYKIDNYDILINNIEMNKSEIMKDIVIDENKINYNSSSEEFSGAINILSNTISNFKTKTDNI